MQQQWVAAVKNLWLSQRTYYQHTIPPEKPAQDDLNAHQIQPVIGISWTTSSQGRKTRCKGHNKCACPAWHTALPGTLTEKLESVQRRALSIAYPDSSYREALQLSGLPTLHDRSEKLSRCFFPGHALPPRTNSTICCPRKGRSAMNCGDRPTVTQWGNMTVSGVLSSLTG